MGGRCPCVRLLVRRRAPPFGSSGIPIAGCHRPLWECNINGTTRPETRPDWRTVNLERCETSNQAHTDSMSLSSEARWRKARYEKRLAPHPASAPDARHDRVDDGELRLARKSPRGRHASRALEQPVYPCSDRRCDRRVADVSKACGDH